jgi:hypothetical protein
MSVAYRCGSAPDFGPVFPHWPCDVVIRLVFVHSAPGVNLHPARVTTILFHQATSN